jgi:HAD superfamily hydrolase (TIGR01509 family)
MISRAPAHGAIPAVSDSRPLQAVIFDVDGTLADTEPEGHRVAFNRAFEEFGLDWYWSVEKYGELLSTTGGKERLRRFVAEGATLPELAARIGIDTAIARLHALKSDIYASMVLAGRIPLRPGVARLIRELRESGLRLAIATTTTPSSLASLIRANFGGDMTALFDVVGAGDIVPRKKPAPDIYHWVLKRLELPAEACIAIEDSPPGLAAARAAGLPTVVTVSAYTAGQPFPDAVSVISDLGDPDRPLRHLAGAQATGSFVDRAQIERWHRISQTSAASDSASPDHRTQKATI